MIVIYDNLCNIFARLITYIGKFSIYNIEIHFQLANISLEKLDQ